MSQASIDTFELPNPDGEGNLQISVWANAAQVDGEVPVLFVTDADLIFATAAEIVSLYGLGGMKPTAMVVGIGYGTDDLMAFTKLRTNDLTPPLDDEGRAKFDHMPSLIGDKSGGADAFLSFLTDTLKPEISRRYPKASATNHALLGHSLGGLFVSRALLTRPDSFAAFLIGSPALWWNGFSTMSLLSAFQGKVDGISHHPRILIGVGGTEQDLPDRAPPGYPMSLEQYRDLIKSVRVIDGAKELVAALRETGLNDVSYACFDGEDHITVLASFLMRSINFFVPRPT
nr:alpha/beta hydrolase-fold protein [uncultured Roseateles sp.]